MGHWVFLKNDHSLLTLNHHDAYKSPILKYPNPPFFISFFGILKPYFSFYDYCKASTWLLGGITSSHI